MFECNDDIDVDDAFLNEVFEIEEDNIGNAYTPRPVSQFPHNPLPSIFCGNESLRINSSHEAVTPGRSVNSNHANNIGLHSTVGCNFRTDDNFFIDSTNKENKRKYESSPPAQLRSKRERKFPGPAGLLPDRKSLRVTPVKLDFPPESENSSPPTTEELGSQGRCSMSVLEEEPWQTLLRDLGPHRSILDVMNVASIKRKVAARCFVGRKVPFLAAVLHHLDVSSPDPCITLRDASGEIHGIVHREVWEQFAGELVVGSVLVVRDVGLLSTGASARRHYLSITANNLATIYSATSEKVRQTRLHAFTSQDFLQSVEKWRTLVSPSHGMGSPASSPSLFNTSRGCSVSPASATGRGRGSAPQVHPTRPSTSMRPQAPQTVKHHPSNFASAQSLRPPVFASTSAAKTFPPNFNAGPRQSISNVAVPPCVNRIPIKENQTKSLQNFAKVTLERNSITQPVKNTNANSFNFNPVNMKPKRFSEDIFPQSNSDRQLSEDIFRLSNSDKNLSQEDNLPSSNSDSQRSEDIFRQSNSERQVIENVQSPDPPSSVRSSNCRPSLVLSQSSQLTAEEQSLVESIFDGVDADSLFDDDF